MDGRIAARRLDAFDSPRATVVLCAPFGFTTEDMFLPALHLLRNGVSVVQFDPRNHHGMSDGDMRTYSLSSHAKDIATVVEAIPEQVIVVALSLAARPALRVLAETPTAGGVVVTPVVWVEDSMRRVTGVDWYSLYRVSPEDVPDDIELLGHRMPRSSAPVDDEAGLLDMAGTLRDASAISVPVHVIAGSDDDWVDLGDVRRVTEAMRSGTLHVLQAAGHKFYIHPKAAKEIFVGISTSVLDLAGVTQQVAVPRFREAIELREELSRL